MKIKYLFIVLVAAIGFFASCNDDKTLGALSGIQVSQSSLSIPQKGGQVSFDITAASDWDFYTDNSKGVAVKDSVPAWITSSHKNGPAGTTTVTFKADSTGSANSATLKIVSGGQTQYINVIQGVTVAKNVTCAEVLAGPDGDTYQVTGTITKLSNTTYGNWYIKDDTGEVYVYGTLDASGAEKNFASLGLGEGDIVTIQGPKKTYNGVVELVNVTVVKSSKSVVTVDSISNGNLPKEGGEFTVHLTNKGDGYFTAKIAEEAQSWVSIKEVSMSGHPEFTFKVAPNTGGAREATITFEAVAGSTKSTVTATVTQEGSIIDCTIGHFNEVAIGSSIQYRITGVITRMDDAAKGNCYVADATGETYVYKMGNSNLKVGDIVTICGVKSEYKGVTQMSSATIESYNVVTPVTVAEFLTKEDSNDVYYLLTGKVTNLKDATYGNYDLEDETGSVYIYGTLAGWGGETKQFASFGINEGDEVSLITIKTSYKGTNQGKNAMIFKAKE